MLVEKTLCIGCGSCAMICPHKCIKMEEDEEGFLYPKINLKKCVSCGLCEKSCPILMKSIEQTYKTKSFAAQNKNEEIRRNSSSGGVFFALALTIVNQGGVVCAAKYSKDFEVMHDIATAKEQLYDFCGAKYAQSRLEECFIKIKELLYQGSKVLFVGTPCQVAGLQAFLKHSHNNLILVDMICHGVPSPFVWRKYLEERKQADANESEIVAINLRDKSTGWSNYSYSVRFEYQNGYVYSVQQNNDKFMQGFTENLYLRPACSHCKFKGVERGSDITLGDYWGVWNHYPEFDDKGGTSWVMIHSQKGLKMWNDIRDNFRTLEISNEQAVQYNPSAIESSSAADMRVAFYEGLQHGQKISDMIQTYPSNQNKGKISIVQRILNKINFHISRRNKDE